MPANWPTADKINARIARSESVNGRVSTLHGRGSSFVTYGELYGINPAVAVAIAQRECQLGADGSALPTVFNYGGITDPTGKRGPCGRVWVRDRYWARYCSVEQGIEGIFKVLDGKAYRSSSGSVRDVMAIYSPPFENDWNRLLQIFSIVGTDLGVTLNSGTQVYLTAPGTTGYTAKVPGLRRLRRRFVQKEQ